MCLIARKGQVRYSEKSAPICAKVSGMRRPILPTNFFLLLILTSKSRLGQSEANRESARRTRV